MSPSGGMVDAADSKSAALAGVRVRLSPRAPHYLSRYSRYYERFCFLKLD